MVDILVLGATGFTGKLITEVLQHHRERSAFSFGIAARSQSKLNKLKKDLDLEEDVQTFIIDITDPQQVEDIVSQANVIINTVGPFWKWGTVVVRACVKLGKHYVDLAGETHWLRDIILEFDYAASAKHCAIVPSCGFDSVPSDLAVYLANKTLKTTAGIDATIDTSTSAVHIKGTVSSGTLSTIITALSEVPRNKLEWASADYSLSNVAGVPSPPTRFTCKLPFCKPPIFGYLSLMAPINRAIVQRTWGLHEYDLRKSRAAPDDKRQLTYGSEFKYEEFFAASNGFSATVSSFFIGTLAVCFLFPPFRWLMKGLLPLFSGGPSEHIKKNGFFKLTNITTSSATPTEEPIHVKTVIRGKGDPGYYLTSYMIVESALALLLSRPQLPSLGREGGVLTPMTAFGDVLVTRLKETGKFTFSSEVVEDD